MKILVINGSPKGNNSITLQTVLYLEKLNPQHTFEILNAGAKIKSLEKDFTPALEAINQADVLLFSYPVYTFIAPCQLHRFIELMKEYGVNVAGKAATQITTSKHFYDVTAHQYIQDNCQEMGMNFVRGLSADMEDLTTKKGQKQAVDFWNHFCWCVEKEYFEPVHVMPVALSYHQATVPEKTADAKDGDVVIITDCTPENESLSAMIARFQAVLPKKTRIVNISEYPFKGGCLGCFNCAVDGTCIYKDGFDTFLRENIQKADAMIYAFTIRDHSMGARFKMYDDRQFCNGHRTVTIGMPVGYLVSGCYSVEKNLQTIIEGRANVGQNILTGVATDEFDPNAEIDRLADELVYALEHKNVEPQNFLGIGGMKIFRDLIYQMQGMMRADHKFFKAQGQYDFPQKNKGQILFMYLVGAMLGNKKLKAKMGGKMNEGMLMPYKKVLDELDKK